MISHKRKHDRQEGEPGLKSQVDSNEEESSPKPSVSVLSQVTASSSTSTPLSSLSAENFLARKRGRPPKKIVSNNKKLVFSKMCNFL